MSASDSCSLIRVKPVASAPWNWNGLGLVSKILRLSQEDVVCGTECWCVSTSNVTNNAAVPRSQEEKGTQFCNSTFAFFVVCVLGKGRGGGGGGGAGL